MMESRVRFYYVLGGLSLLVLLVLLFWGPTGPEDKKKALLWDADWQRIEYHHLTDAEPATANLKPEKLLVLFRKSTLQGDRYQVASAGDSQASPGERRPGNYNVSNSFQDWLKPQHKGIYKPDAEKLKLGGLNQPIAELRFLESDEDEPLRLVVGKRQSNGSYFTLLKEPGEEDVLVILGSHYVERLQYDHLQYREKRMLYYPANSYTARIELAIDIANLDQPANIKKVQLYQKRREVDGKPEIKWYLERESGAELELPQHLVNPLESFIKQLQVKHFNDEPSVREYNSKDLWQESGRDYLKVRVQIHDGDTVKLSLRKPAREIQLDDSRLLLIKNAADSFIDFSDARIVRDIRLHVQNLLRYKPPQNAVGPDQGGTEAGGPVTPAPSSGPAGHDGH